MKFPRVLIAAAALLAVASIPAISQVRVVTSCGVIASPLPVGSTGQALFMDVNGNLCAGAGVTSTSRIVSAANSNNATVAKATPGRIYGIQGYNAASAVRYLKLYNKTTAPTVGTDTPVKTLALPPAAGFAYDFPNGYYFSTGIGYGLVTGSADNDNTAVTAADIVGLNIDYN